MNEQIGVSGCFGGASAYPVDDVDDVAAAVEEIVETAQPANEQPVAEATDIDMALLVGQYVRRVRLLTWAVVVLAAVIAIKELK